MTVLPNARLVSTANLTLSSAPSLPRAIAPSVAVPVLLASVVSIAQNRFAVLYPAPTDRCAKANTVIAMMDGMASTAMSARQTMHVMR